MIIEIKEVSKAYGENKVLDNFSLNIEDEHSYVITGKEGCGKTTLMRLILKLETPDAGKVGLLGDYKYPFINAGVVFQDDRLVESLNAITNVTMVSKKIFRETVAEELLKFLPEEALTVPVKKLSESQRRIVQIIRACAIPSDVLIMDEPFLGIDRETKLKLIPYIRNAQGKGSLTIFTRDTTDLDFARIITL
ncbi:ABC transporter ATP-binding protein [Butyrivibrio proteoclasticus B316]|uniref:ABC transporter ATP-binding protein n=1 Tax=Butyrivibrio proteoclasticus (strain ATCC 51982 / DSM 14932 / B316) TaxID=515622 RepID=E0S1B9_BUTPB|nr:ATP-binding cassette domain-containing protein [Butyrivibrio proteoclasticus]ADL33594.1 ABC transporter ATP-binding protein [Butyrivibrio proteoclasticus B316]